MKIKDIPTSITVKRDNSSYGGGLFANKTAYKFWVLAVLLLLAFWSMFTGSISLKWSSGDLTISEESNFFINDDLDILEVEDREKVVRRMWDVYKQSNGAIRLPRFWLEAFEAAYEYLVSDVRNVRESAVSEIAKLSLSSLNLDSLLNSPVQSSNTNQPRKIRKQPDETEKETAVAAS